MPYSAPTVTIDGPVIPAFSDIHAWLIAQYKDVCGADLYTGNDAWDIQLLGIIARAANDCNQMSMAAYLGHSPTTASGISLSSAVKINGLTRAIPTYSTVNVTIVGQAGTAIINGTVRDTSQYLWDFPSTVTIPLSGSIDVTATCQTQGAITASIGAVSIIGTPTRGWQSVTNAAIAAPGNPVETDGGLRIRQTLSVANPSLSLLQSILGGVYAVLGVTNASITENATGSTDSNGIAAHSIAVVTIGGDSTAIGTAIASRIGPGVSTVGTTTVNLTDTFGNAQVVHYSVASAIVIKITIAITALSGFSSAFTPVIKQAAADYVNALKIGEEVRFARIIGPVTDVSTTFTLTALTTAKGNGAYAASDITIAYNEIATCVTTNVTVNVT